MDNNTQEQSKLLPHQTEEYKQDLNKLIQNLHQYSIKKPLKTQDRARIKSPTIRYKTEDIHRWLQNPVQNEERLRTLSNYLYNTNALYKWVINTIALMPKYNWTLTQNSLTSKKSKSQRKNTYYEALEYVDKLNLPHELIKVFLIMLKEDWYYGYEIESDDAYFILHLDANYCKPSSRNLDGTYNYKFNFSYFNDKEEMLATYPTEFKFKYEQYKSTRDSWIELDANKTICLKFNDEFEYAMPYYATLFTALADLDYYQEIKKDRAALENTLLIHQYVPIDENDYNKFAIGADLIKFYHQMAEQATEDNVSVITSPMKVEAVKTERSNSGTDYVEDALRDFYTSSGLPQHLSNSANNTAIGLDKAIVVNEQLVFRFYRQIERIVTRKLRHKFPTIKFKFKLLDTTSFNQSKVVDTLLTLAQNGGTKLDVFSASGKSPYEFFNDIEMENNVFDLVEQLKPLKTSHTQSGNDEGGRPPKDSGDLSESGQKTRDNESNEKKKANQ